ncbi:TRAP transporter substrate-binding protein [Chrysiogenes arsenatis]|uniref:TRAP transporter substrate-binding protein n=1 Tax=Chrysiogenes arsenatis TaxID=309797 RepID=UPI0004291ADF|nr:TRAP transporter substrate-binding protein DctP [Chrysiogenes arsenatis]
MMKRMKPLALLLLALCAVTLLATGAVANDKKVRWRMATTWSTSLPWQDTAIHFAETVKTITNGQLEIRVFPAEAIVPAFELLDAVQNGVVQMGHDWPGYWKGKDEAFVAFASVPFGLNNVEYTTWLISGGGLELANELYGRFNTVPLLGGNSGQEMGFFTAKPLSGIADLKGKTVRTVGWGGDILKNAGAAVTPLPGGEIYLAFERGILDGAEFSTPFVTFPMGFQEIAKNVMVPGWHQPAVQNMFTVNKKAWDALPAHLQAALKVASYETQLWDLARSEKGNAETIAKYKQAGVSFNKLDSESLMALRKTTKEYMDGLRAKHPFLDKVMASQDAFTKEYSVWKEIRSGVSAYPYEDYMKGTHTE